MPFIFLSLHPTHTMNSLGKWDHLSLILKFYLLPAHLIHLDMRNNYEHRLVMHPWDGFLREWDSVALWDAHEIKVSGTDEAASMPG